MARAAWRTAMVLGTLVVGTAYTHTSAGPSTANEAAPSERTADTPHLDGIVLGENGWTAYIEDPVTKVVHAYHVGDTLGDRTIETIEDTRVVLRGSAGRLEIRLNYETLGVTKKPR